jgi:basic amino acid/polyamine antiporter, APA family
MASTVEPPRPAEQTLFVRKASGLVKGWSGGDGFRYSFMSVNLFLAIWSFAYATFIPGGSLFWSIVITAAFVVLEILVYAGLISAMPRAGGDYVWMTRIFNSAIGFVIAAIGWWFILWLWTPIYADMGVQTTVKPIFRILGVNSWADWLGSRTGIFVASLVVIAIASTLVAIGMKAYAKFQKWAMWIGLVGVLVAGILLLVTSGDSFKQHFNDAATKYYGGDAGLLNLQKYKTDETGAFVYDDAGSIVVDEGQQYPGAFEAVKAVGSGTGMPTSTFSGGIGWLTWTLIPFMMFWMAWPNWGATLYGEVRGAKDFRKNVYQMLGGLFVPTVIALAFLALMTWKVGYQAFMGMMASYWYYASTGANVSPLGGDYVSPTAMISWIVPNAAFQIILIAAISLLLFGWFGTLFLSSTRMIFAAAFDRILPEAAAKVTNSGVPVIALVLMTIPSIIMAALYAYTPVNDTYGVTVVKLFTYDATFGILIMFLGTCLAFMVMKWRANTIWESSSLPKAGIGGIPWMAIAAAIYSAFLVFNFYLYIKDALYGVNNKQSAVFMAVLYVAAIVVWVVAWAVRKSQGMQLESVAKEIPVE